MLVYYSKLIRFPCMGWELKLMMVDFDQTVLFYFLLILLLTVLMGLLVHRRYKNKTSNKLEAAEQDYHSLFEQNPDIVVKLSLDGVILSLNHTFSDITGY